LADELIKILKMALNLSRAKGTYEGLCEGRRLVEFQSRIDRNPARRYLVKRIDKFPEATGQGTDRNLCSYMDKQIQRLQTLRTLAKDIPYPLESWKKRWWVDALKEKPSAVSKYITVTRNLVSSEEYTFLLAWERFGKPKPASDKAKKPVRHRDLGLDKLYD
jgi:hypothetical protein